MRRFLVIAAIILGVSAAWAQKLDPNLNRTDGAAAPAQPSKSDGELSSDERSVIRGYLLDVQAVLDGGDRDAKLDTADMALTKLTEALLSGWGSRSLSAYVDIMTKMGRLLAMARFLSDPNPSWIFKREDFVKARDEYDSLYAYLDAIATNR
jgi:hypothetical protein